MLAKTILTAALSGMVLFMTANGQTPDGEKESLKRLEIIITLQQPPPESPIVNGEKCGKIIEGWQLCTTTPFVLTDSPQNVVVILKIKNINQNNATIEYGDFYDYYVATVFNPNGKRMLSYREESAKRDKSTEEDLREELSTNSTLLNTELAPSQDYYEEFNLAQFYDFSIKGKYKVFLVRKITERNESAMNFGGTIEIEIK